MAETKQLESYSLGVSVVSVTSTAFAAGTSVIPLGLQPGALVLNQGTGQGQRVGNKVSISSATFKGTVFPAQYGAATNVSPHPMQIRLWIFYDKENPTSNPLPDSGDFFQSGNIAAGFSNGLADLWRPINTDRWRILASRTFKLGYAAYSGTGSNADPQFYSNNDFKLNQNFSINFAKLIPKLATFDDNVGDAMQRQCYAMFCPFYADGTPVAFSTVPAIVSYMQQVSYKDM